MKQCRTCEETKTLDSFHKKSSAKDGLSSSCKECKNKYLADYHSKRNAQRYQEDPDTHRKAAMKTRYKMTLDEYNNMLRDQNYGCMICGGTNKSGRALAVDHNHTCCPGKTTCGKCIRGLLCSNCNRAIGLFKDDSELLRKAATYIDNYS